MPPQIPTPDATQLRARGANLMLYMHSFTEDAFNKIANFERAITLVQYRADFHKGCWETQRRENEALKEEMSELEKTLFKRFAEILEEKHETMGPINAKLAVLLGKWKGTADATTESLDRSVGGLKDYNELAADHAALLEKCKVLEEQVEDGKDAFDKEAEEVKMARRAKFQLELDLAGLMKDIGGLKVQLEDKDKKIDADHEDYDNLLDENWEKNIVIGKLKEQLEGEKKVTTELKSQLEAKEKEISDEHEDWNKLVCKFREKENEMKKLTEENERLKANNSHLLRLLG